MRLANQLTIAAGMLLIAISACLLMAGHDRALVAPPDPVLGVSSRLVLWGMGALAGVVGLVCIFAKRELLPVFLVAWLTFSLLIYRSGYFFLGTTDAQAYVAMTAAEYGLSARTFLVGLTSVVVCLGLWSWFSLVLLVRNKPQSAPSQNPKHPELNTTG